MRHFQGDPVATRPREQCTVGVLRAEAADVDTVTRVGRLADERDAEYFRALAGRGLAKAKAEAKPTA
jgi:hypothetical protein